MIKLKSLILEERLKANYIGKVIQNAYSTIFDIDKVVLVETRDLLAPSYMHQYASINIFLVYKTRGFFIYHKLLHYKFPKQELKGLSYDEWMDMLKHAEQMPDIEASAVDIRNRNPLISFNASVYEAENEKESYFNHQDIGESNHNRNIGEMVANVKKMIDKYIEGEGGPKDEVPPTPVAPTVIKEPALTEGYYKVVVGSIGMDDAVQSYETRKTHTQCEIQRGKCWRYSPQTKVVYWGEDYHTDEEAFRIEDHLDKKYNYEVKSHVDLGNVSDSDFETRMKHWNSAHGNL